MISYRTQQAVLNMIDKWLNMPMYLAADNFTVLAFMIDQAVPTIGLENVHIYNIGNIRDRIAEMPVVEDN